MKHSQSKRLGKRPPLTLGKILGASYWFGPGDETIFLAQVFAFPEVGRSGVMNAHDGINPLGEQFGNRAVGAESQMTQDLLDNLAFINKRDLLHLAPAARTIHRVDLPHLGAKEQLYCPSLNPDFCPVEEICGAVVRIGYRHPCSGHIAVAGNDGPVCARQICQVFQRVIAQARAVVIAGCLP